MMMIMILTMVMIPCAFSDAPFNVVRDYKWRNLGVCAYCSVEQRCCGAMKYGVENGTIEPMFIPNSASPTRVTVQITARSPDPDPTSGEFIRYTVSSDVELRKEL